MKLKDFSTIELLDELRRRELDKEDIDITNFQVGDRVYIISCDEKIYWDYDDEGYYYGEHIGRTGVINCISIGKECPYKIAYDCVDFEDTWWNAHELKSY